MNLAQERAKLASHYGRARAVLIAEYEQLMDDPGIEHESVILLADRVGQLRRRQEAIERMVEVFWLACQASTAATGAPITKSEFRILQKHMEPLLSNDILPIEDKWFQEDCLNMARLRDGIEIKYKEYQEVSLQELIQENRNAI